MVLSPLLMSFTCCFSVEKLEPKNKPNQRRKKNAQKRTTVKGDEIIMLSLSKVKDF